MDFGQIQTLSRLGNSESINETIEETFMVNLLDSKEVVEFKERLMANTIQIDTMYQLLLQKGYFTEAEFLVKMKEVKAGYQRI